MNKLLAAVAVGLLLVASPVSAKAKLKAKPPQVVPAVVMETPEGQAAYADIEKTLGIVPDFLRLLPESSLASAWDQMKSVQLAPGSAIGPKYKELIALAVSAQIPCRSCAYFHAERAKSLGATDKELREAAAVAGAVRLWSTVINTVSLDEKTFHPGGIQSQMLEAAKAEGAAETVAVTDAESAFKDIGRFFGFVPQIFRAVPAESIASAWRSLKTAVLTDGAIPRKYRDLIAIGVAAQTSCRYCGYLHSEVARYDGVTEKETHEAVAVSALTRQWSTILDAASVDEAAFRKQVEQIVRTLRRS